MMASDQQPAESPRRRYWPIWVLISINILVGLLIFRGYGLSTDEPANLKYSQFVIDFYRSPFASDYSLFEQGLLDYKGPAYFVAARLIANLGGGLFPGVGVIAFWHLVDFLLFQLAVFCIYRLALRWMDEWGAFGAALIFATQPLLWGHAFINPKDSPFMVLFLASITTGLIMADHVLEVERSTAVEPGSTAGTAGSAPAGTRVVDTKMAIAIGAIILLAFGAGAAFNWRKSIIAAVVLFIHRLPPTNPVLVGYSHLAASPILDTLRVAIFGDKGFLTGLIVLAIIVVVVLAGIGVLSFRRPEQARRFLRRFGSSFKDSKVVWAGILLGLTVSIRILGPYAGALVVLWMLLRGRWTVLPAVLAYIIIAFLVVYLSWPFLWANPLARLLESVRTMSDYPWEGQVLFQGQLFPGTGLPVAYIPTLMTIQLTEPVWILFAISLPVVAYRYIKSRSGLDLILLLLMWFVLPVMGFMVLRPTLYNNIRQLHFLLPPIFIYAGVGLSFLLARIRWRWLRLTLLLVLALPGILGIARLYPYEYTYYNSFVGGEAGAFRRFDSDYWETSSAEATRFINQVAMPGSSVLITGSAHLFTPYLRPDLHLFSLPHRAKSIPAGSYDYVLLTTRDNKDLGISSGNLPTLAVIGRQGMTYMIIKRGLASP